jgi:hypothetical protein
MPGFITPYSNPYSVNLAGLQEAVIKAVQQMIIDSLADLNTSLGRDSLSPMPALTTAQIVRGNPSVFTQTLICVVAGGTMDSLVMRLEGLFMPRGDLANRREVVQTGIIVKVHSDDMLPAGTDPVVTSLQTVNYMEIALARICDHLRRRVFNVQQGAIIQLDSHEHNTSAPFDQLLDCGLKEIRKDTAPTGIGGSAEAYFAMLLHEGYIA